MYDLVRVPHMNAPLAVYDAGRVGHHLFEFNPGASLISCMTSRISADAVFGDKPTSIRVVVVETEKLLVANYALENLGRTVHVEFREFTSNGLEKYVWQDDYDLDVACPAAEDGVGVWVFSFRLTSSKALA